MIQTSGIFTGGGDGGKYKPYLTFRSPYTFTLSVATPGWNGTVEYSTDTETWTTWGGSQITAVLASAGDDAGYYALYLRGTGNTTMVSSDVTSPTGLTVTGSDVYCVGSVETLLDYQAVDMGGHPAMATGCFRIFFKGCPIVTPPDLPATTLSESCYAGMFQQCTQLVVAPELPATILPKTCYRGMFNRCSSLILPPKLLAKEYSISCCLSMFSNCSSLIGIPALRMSGELQTSICMSMFSGCAKIKLSSVQEGEYSKVYTIPFTGSASYGDTAALSSMFRNTGGTFVDDPVINTTYYVSNTNIVV